MSSILGTDYLPETPPSQDEKNLAMVTHLLTFFSSFIAPLVIYIIKKNESQFVAEHARQALNFHISIFVIAIILIISIIGIFFFILAPIISIFIIVAAIRASEGRLYKYPFTIEFIK